MNFQLHDQIIADLKIRLTKYYHKANCYLFEMKSVTEKNVHFQMRKSLSQLYEYRFLQNIPDANLVVVLETYLPKELWWMIDYFEHDRGIYVIWDGNEELYSSSKTRKELSVLGIDRTL